MKECSSLNLGAMDRGAYVVVIMGYHGCVKTYSKLSGRFVC